jgi:hypothetical protein
MLRPVGVAVGLLTLEVAVRLNTSRIVLFGLLLALIVVPGFAQRTTSTFAGIVTDPSGAVLPGAEIQMFNQETGATLQQLTSETGEFVFDFVPVGTYTFKIAMPGFKGYESRGIPLSAAQSVRRTYVMEVGSVSDNITVTDAAPMVNTVSPEQRLSLDRLEVGNLPMVNRNVTNILDVASGLTKGDVNNVGFSGTRFRLNGLGGSSMSVTANGTDANGNAGTLTISAYGAYNKIDVMSAESVAEVQIVKGVMPAEYGSAMAGAMTLISKSGTNTWHGSLFHRYEGSVLSARQPFLTHESNSVWNQFGGSFGGPIKRDKLFFFAAYEGYRQTTSIALAPPPTVPTPYFRDILMRSLPADDIGLLLNHYPLPNQPYGPTDLLARWVGSGIKQNKDDHIDAKIDYLIGGGNLSVSAFGGHPFQIQAAAQPLNPQITNAFTRRLNGNYVIGKGRLTSSTRAGINWNYFDRIDAIWNARDPHRAESLPAGRGLPGISFPGLTGFNRDNRQQGLIPSYSIEQQFALFNGTHSWKFGALLSLPSGGQAQTTSSQVNYLTLADVQANTPSSVAYTANKYPSTWRMVNFGLFAQDDWRVNSKLVLNLGLRYDRYGHFVIRPWKGEFGRSLDSYNLLPEVEKSLEGKLPMGLYNFDGLLDSTKFTWGPLRDVNNPFNSDNFNLSPRVGFAYTADGKGDFVVRGGFGVNFQGFDPSTYEGNAQQSAALPRSRNFTRAEAASFGLKYPIYTEDVMQFFSVLNPQNTPQLSNRWNPDTQAPYAMNYTLGIQRALTPTIVFETAFVGTRGVKFNMARTANQVDRITSLRPNPTDIASTYYDNSQQTNYNSWQTTVKQRLTRGLLFNVNYTWGKALSYSGGDVSAAFIGDTVNNVEDFDNVRIERSLSAGDIMHTFVADWVYMLPKPFANTAIGRHALGGWQLAGIWRTSTGAPISLTQTGGRPDIIDGDNAINPNCCSFGNLQYLNPAAFRTVTVSSASSRTIRRGSANSTPFRGSGNYNLDISVGKTFPLRETVNLELRSDMQNVLNHTQYTNVSTNMANVDFGQIVGARSARVVQLQLRLSF